MKIIEINGRDAGSTGRIAYGIAEYLKNTENDDFLYLSTVEGALKSTKILTKSNHIIYGTHFTNLIVKCFGRFTGFQECYSLGQTSEIIKIINKFKPDIVHLHVMHNSYLNLLKLFNYFKGTNLHIVWTFHDCWAITGRCPYFLLSKCNEWKKDCSNCNFDKKAYPPTLFNHSKFLLKRKKKLFEGLNNIHIVTPSYWLEDLVRSSFLSNYPVSTIHNGIDLSLFRRSECNDFREKNHLTDKFILLGVSNCWNNQKGLNDFIKLSTDLPDNFRIVLIGTNQVLDKMLPDNVLSIHHTGNFKELSEIYSSADLFINPTYEDNFPTVDIEAMACGTPVLAYDIGGVKEAINDSCGECIPCGDYNKLLSEIIRIEKERPFNHQKCIEHSMNFDMNKCWENYRILFSELISKS